MIYNSVPTISLHNYVLNHTESIIRLNYSGEQYYIVIAINNEQHTIKKWYEHNYKYTNKFIEYLSSINTSNEDFTIDYPVVYGNLINFLRLAMSDQLNAICIRYYEQAINKQINITELQSYMSDLAKHISEINYAHDTFSNICRLDIGVYVKELAADYIIGVDNSHLLINNESGVEIANIIDVNWEQIKWLCKNPGLLVVTNDYVNNRFVLVFTKIMNRIQKIYPSAYLSVGCIKLELYSHINTYTHSKSAKK